MGSGGIDGSIQFELGYGENGGSAFTGALTQFRSVQQEGISMADMIVSLATRLANPSHNGVATYCERMK